MKSLGLDLSTVCCGWAITEDSKILDAGFFDISKSKTYKEKAQLIIDGLKNIQFDVIIVEEALSGFAFGRSNMKSILSLIKNKAVICYILEEVWQKTIHCANATTMRKQLFGKARVKGIPSKIYVKTKIESMFDISKWLILNRNGVPDKKMEDIYDAIVASFYRP